MRASRRNPQSIVSRTAEMRSCSIWCSVTVPAHFCSALAPFDAAGLNLTLSRADRCRDGQEYGFFIEAATDWKTPAAEAAWRLVLALAESGRNQALFGQIILSTPDTNKLTQLRTIIASLDETLVKALCGRAVFKVNAEPSQRDSAPASYRGNREPLWRSIDHCRTHPHFATVLCQYVTARVMRRGRRGLPQVRDGGRQLHDRAGPPPQPLRTCGRVEVGEIPEALRQPLIERDPVLLKLQLLTIRWRPR